MHGQVITPSAGGPAERAGIEPRDGLVAIDGKQTEGLSLYEAGDMLQGAEGSEVTFQSCILQAQRMDKRLSLLICCSLSGNQ